MALRSPVSFCEFCDFSGEVEIESFPTVEVKAAASGRENVENDENVENVYDPEENRFFVLTMFWQPT